MLHILNLLNAARNGDLATVERWIATGADINIFDHRGLTPLHLASRSGHEAIVEMLIAAGADVNAKNKDDCTPFAWAGSAGHESMLEKLIAAGAHFGPVESVAIQDGEEMKTRVIRTLYRRLVKEVAEDGQDIASHVIGRNGHLTDQGLDYVYGGVLPAVLKPCYWKGHETEGLEFYEALVKAIPDDLKEEVEPRLVVTELRRGASKVRDQEFAVERYLRPRGGSPKGLG